MLNLQHALFCNDVSAHTHIYTHIILYKASIWILNVLFLITPLRIILLFTAPPKIIVHCAHYIESPYELCCILAHELLCVSRTFLKAPPQRMMLYFLLCLYTPLYSMHFVQTRHKNDCASHKNRPALLLCTLVPILFFAIYKQIKKVFFRQRPYRVECTGSLPNSEVKRRRARLVLGWGTAREDLRVLSALSADERTPLLVERERLLTKRLFWIPLLLNLESAIALMRINATTLNLSVAVHWGLRCSEFRDGVGDTAKRGLSL